MCLHLLQPPCSRTGTCWDANALKRVHTCHRARAQVGTVVVGAQGALRTRVCAVCEPRARVHYACTMCTCVLRPLCASPRGRRSRHALSVRACVHAARRVHCRAILWAAAEGAGTGAGRGGVCHVYHTPHTAVHPAAQPGVCALEVSSARLTGTTWIASLPRAAPALTPSRLARATPACVNV